MQLSALLASICPVPAAVDRLVTRLLLDSRKVNPGDIFVAVQGGQSDGRRFVADAIANGASAILVETNAESANIQFHESIPVIPVFRLKEKLGLLAARLYDHPAKQLRMIGVTGTNGKTSCTHFIAQMLKAMNISCGVMGTLGNGFYGALGEAGLTTPDAITLQAALKNFVASGAQAVAMEVSSHSIHQGRINEIAFETGIFTNLTQDHLDYHGDMETYAAVKKCFLAEWPIKYLLLNADDAYGLRWIHEMAGQRSVYAYAVSQPVNWPKPIPLTYVCDAAFSLQGIQADVVSPWGRGELIVPLIGQFNLSNILAVLNALCLYGIPFEAVLNQFKTIKPVPGRMQTLGGNKGEPLVVVDYSHTPDALEKALQALRGHTQGKLICVFGCGGDRDPLKRPLMARIAEQWADQVLVTNDNPRHENPEAIARQIRAGFSSPDKATIELDRSKAIQKSIQWASEKDCVLIAGKGAERYQQLGDEKFPFDDVEQAGRYLGRQ